MRGITYYVATSIDGFITGPNEDISGFIHYEDVVARYLDDLKYFDTTIMGRRTYEIGYDFGIKPGQPAYPHMQHYIFSNTLTFENQHDQVHVCKLEKNKILELKNQEGSEIYLCGGGKFAGWLLDLEMIDTLKIKLNPIIFGDGIRMFGPSKSQIGLQLKEKESFPGGIQILEYKVLYNQAE